MWTFLGILTGVTTGSEAVGGKTMRERLIRLIDQADEECKHTKDCKICSGNGKGSQCMNYHIADYLLANKVTIQPIKVGDIVFLLLEKLTAGYDIIESKCVRVEQTVYGTTYSVGFPCLEIGNTLEFDETDIGITVFLSNEEAQEKKKSLMEDWTDEDEG